MSFGDVTRINTNIQAMQSYSSLQNTNSELGIRRQRLSTGSKLNRAEDDSASYSIAKKLESRVRGQGQALSNIGDAKGMLTVAEGSLNSTMDILQTMKEKAVQAANDSLGAKERTAIQSQLTELAKEINDIAANTDFNGKKLLSGDYEAAADALTFQVGADQGDTFKVNIAAVSAGALGNATATIDALDVTDATGNATTRADAIGAIDSAINQVSDQIAGLGDSQTRLSFKQENLSTAKTNYEASRSRLEDADFAKEQMEIAKLQILQQTGNASLAQANASSQSVLQLLG